jgi:hypothetical protein
VPLLPVPSSLGMTVDLNPQTVPTRIQTSITPFHLNEILNCPMRFPRSHGGAWTPCWALDLDEPRSLESVSSDPCGGVTAEGRSLDLRNSHREPIAERTTLSGPMLTQLQNRCNEYCECRGVCVEKNKVFCHSVRCRGTSFCSTKGRRTSTFPDAMC